PTSFKRAFDKRLFDRIPVRSNEPTTSLYRAGLTICRHVEQMFELGRGNRYSRLQIGITGLEGRRMDNGSTDNAATGAGDAPRPKGKPGRKPKGSVPPVVLATPDKPEPGHVLTWRQRKVLQVIRDSVQKRGYPPSMREIGEAVGLTSTSSVSYQLSTLQRKGYLHRDVGRPRTVEVRLPGHPAVRPEPGREREPEVLPSNLPGNDIPSQEAAFVPLIGRIAAGGPILAEQYVEDIFPLPRQ